MEEVVVLIVGAGPSGLAVSNCLSRLSISNIVLEREDCCASLWRKRSYDRLTLHLAKQFCSLPYMPHAPSSSTFMPRKSFVEYIDSYISRFGIKPRYCRSVDVGLYVESERKWRVEARNTSTQEKEVYLARFLVIATGENGEGFVPELPGLDGFEGKIVHSSEYKSGKDYGNKEVLVVGCGNSGMEISYDLSNFGAHTSIVIRNPFHVLNKEMVYIGMLLSKYVPMTIADAVVTFLEKLWYGDLTRYGICRPAKGPFHLKVATGKTPVIDVGTIKKIQSGDIKVLPGIVRINGNNVMFENGVVKQFDDIIFATGYKSTANYWLKDYECIMNKDGMPKCLCPHHWKGENGIYCAGFSKQGLAGIARDSVAIANDIGEVLNGTKEKIKIN
ncbi:probable indole-3-pyruvate monooxygenase YUCCA10 [Syzygium oleosum]|uniref:probable indole-3-pyruvate monooxygenase YUCCA10 n=1 Tax=Syzygium oleosum TaxID=219896 RepID=UPI0011D1AF50|nr:probable indole-3-pyruvate monooxygenase YUCCA10 [Syzygium oleosum]